MKKGLSLTVTQWIPRIIFLTIVVFSVLFLVRMHIRYNIEIPGLEADIFVSRLLYSPNGFTYVDPDTRRPYPGIIDLDKFNAETVVKAIDYGEDHIAARIMLESGKEFIYNQDESDKWAPLSFIQKGLGAIKSDKIKVKVLVYDEGGYLSDHLVVEYYKS